MKKTEELLRELSDRIGEIRDVKLAKEMTNIFIDLTQNIQEMSNRYWSLVSSIKTLENQAIIFNKENETK